MQESLGNGTMVLQPLSL